jgi:hypothetical protein
MSSRRLLLPILFASSCSGGNPPAGPGPDAAVGDGGAVEGGASQCMVELATPADEGASHLAECTATTYRSRPPSSGNHYPRWAVFRVYSKPVPWGYLVHAMEHGVVVIVYNCPDGCAEEVAAAQALVDSTPLKGACPRPPVILAPDPTLDVRFAAASWGNTLRASCFDREAFARFVETHKNHGPEFSEADCGVVDLEARNWCANTP